MQTPSAVRLPVSRRHPESQPVSCGLKAALPGVVNYKVNEVVNGTEA